MIVKQGECGTSETKNSHIVALSVFTANMVAPPLGLTHLSFHQSLHVLGLLGSGAKLASE